MPFVSSNNVSIHYEIEGDESSPPLLLHHGWTSDIESWRDFGYVSALRDRYRLILIDARGHGSSESPALEEDFAPKRFVEDVEAVLDAAEVRSVTFWGYSMGAAVGFQLAVDAPNRVDRLIAGGMHPYGTSTTGRPRPTRMTTLLRQRGMKGFVEERGRALGGKLVSGLRNRLLSGDAEGLAAAGEAWAGWIGVGEQADQITRETLLYAGTADPDFHDGAKRAAAEMPNARFVSLPGMSHDAAFASSRTVLASLADYLH
ncbi:MAG: alpha/beta hydrolase [Chloroflexi bacterium]|nr:alpha/beta hydrolase [Chloroflexota bacterium]